MDLKWSKEEGSVAHPVLLIQPIFEKMTTTTNIKYSQMFVLLRIDMFPVSGFLLETVQNMLLAKPARKQQPQQLGKYWQEPILINMVKNICKKTQLRIRRVFGTWCLHNFACFCPDHPVFWWQHRSPKVSHQMLNLFWCHFLLIT